MEGSWGPRNRPWEAADRRERGGGVHQRGLDGCGGPHRTWARFAGWAGVSRGGEEGPPGDTRPRGAGGHADSNFIIA